MRLLLLPILAAAALGFAGAAHAANTTSANWSGYAVSGAGQSFSDVKGTWVQPAPACPAHTPSFSSFWVGLGGFAPGATALEQIGTSADCHNGLAVDSAWYELIPAPPVSIPIDVHAGDSIAAEVTVVGTAVTLTITDATTFTTTVTIAAPDTSSAEWISEAPSQCLTAALSSCRALPLAPFGTASFSAAFATANDHTGAIADAAWTPTAITLRSKTDGVSAAPSELGADGASFSVATSSPPSLRALARRVGDWLRPHRSR